MLTARETVEESPRETPLSCEAWTDDWPQTRPEFERLVVTFQDRLVRYAFRRLGNLADAEDVVQEVLIRTWTERTRRRKVAHVGAYLYRAAANLCTDFLRKRRRLGIPLEDTQVIEIPTKRPNAIELATAAEELRRIDALLERIPPRQAEIVRLRVFADLRLNQIAEIVGRSLPTVKSRLRYGLEKLRTIVLEEWGIER